MSRAISRTMSSAASVDLQGAPHSPGQEDGARYPGQPAMWFFVIGDLWIFTCYFMCYIYDRGQSPDNYLLAQQTLNQNVGVLNTILLLTSSLLVAFSVQAARTKAFARARSFLLLGGCLGVLFLLFKGFEWYVKIANGLAPESNGFFIYYFMFTGLHFFHVCLGLVILSLVFNELKKGEQSRTAFVESGAIYWHLVDLLWIIIFALLYLIR